MTLGAPGGVSVTAAEADTPAAVAVTRTDCWLVIDPGAVYNPEAESVPTCGLNDQVTGSPVLLTVAENCCCPPCPSVLAVGFMEIVTMAGGVRVTSADAETPPRRRL